MSTLSDAIGAEFRRILTERKLTVTSAARQLRISRQAFHSYLSGKSVPRHKTLGLAMERWDLKLRIGDEVFDHSSFPKQLEAPKPPEQLPIIWGALDSIRQQDLKIGVRREGSVFNVEVQINIPA